MACSERSSLWGFAAGELAVETRERVEQHLVSCEECRHELEAVTATREVLSAAAPLAPQVDWRRADEQVHGAVERRFARLERRWSWTLAFALGVGATAVVVAMFAVGGRGPALPEIPLPLPMASTVESADGALFFAGADEHLLKPGEDLPAGTALRTTVSGKAFFKLPEGSRVRVASATDLVVDRAASYEVGLVLKKGRVAIQATHAARKEFVVEAGGATVRVIGTVFSVGMTDEATDVAVTEGRVLVDLPDGSSKIVSAGERMVLDRVKNEARSAALTASDKSEMNELGIPVVLAEVKKPLAYRPAAPAPVLAAPIPMPVPEQIPIEPAVLTAAEPSASAVPVARPTGSKLQEVPVEMQKIDEVEFALKKGRCTADLAEQLANMLEDRTDMEQSDVENALILRARCLDKLGQTVKADRAYRAYKDAFPHGRFAAEASRSLPH